MGRTCRREPDEEKVGMAGPDGRKGELDADRRANRQRAGHGQRAILPSWPSCQLGVGPVP
jgi:hypothetical protein